MVGVVGVWLEWWVGVWLEWWVYGWSSGCMADILSARGDFRMAMRHFCSGATNTTVVLGLFPDLLPAKLPASMEQQR
jgi:hypothetical protein